MIKKLIIIGLLVWCYKNPDKVCDSMVRLGIGFKTGVDASHKPYAVKLDNETVAQTKKPNPNPNLPGPDGLIDPYPEE